MCLTCITVMKFKNTPKSLKSKHSAEHMVVNFLEINMRLPKNAEEVKSYSRFSKDCGSKQLVSDIAERFVGNILAAIFAVIVKTIIISIFGKSWLIEIIFKTTKYWLKINN